MKVLDSIMKAANQSWYIDFPNQRMAEKFVKNFVIPFNIHYTIYDGTVDFENWEDFDTVINNFIIINDDIKTTKVETTVYKAYSYPVIKDD